MNNNLRDFLWEHSDDYICINDKYSLREDVAKGHEWLLMFKNAEDYTVTYIGEGSDNYDYYISIE